MLRLLPIFLPILVLLVHCQPATDSESEPLELAFEVTPVTTAGGSDGAIDLTVTGGELPYEFSWSNGADTEDITNLVVGVYTVQVTSHDGQSLVDSAAVELVPDSGSEPLELAFDVTPVTTAGGSDGAIDLTVTGGELPYQYSWSNGAVTEDIANLVVGVYTVQVQSHDGQSLVDSAVVEALHDSNTVTDVDGYTYPTVRIGDQWWLAENFRATRADDGSALAGVYAYNNDAGNVAEYGRLYTWNAARNACPAGWHLPTDAEWDVLEACLGADAGTRLKTGGDTGFNAKIAGYRDAAGGFSLLGEWTMFWSATYYTNDHAYVRNLFHDQTGIVRSGVDVNAAVSVRYIRDN